MRTTVTESAIAHTRALIRSCRPLAHANIAPPIVFGQALALAVTGRFSWGWAIVAHAWGLLDHLFIVWSNDVADREADAANTTHNLFSGGSRVIPEGALSARTLASCAVAAALTLTGLSIAVARERPALWVLALVAIGLLLAYSFPPARLSYRGGGELLQGLGVGVVLPCVGFYLQSGELSALPLAALAPTFVLGVAGNVMTALPDEPADRAAAKRTWPVRRGGRRARRDLLVLVALTVSAGPALMPGLSSGARLVTALIALAPLAAAFRLLPHAEPRERLRLVAFMVAVGASSSLAILAWSIALALS